jgi:hypothetical protein
MLRMVPFGDSRIFLRPNSFTRASSGVMVAHLTATPCRSVAFAESTVNLIFGIDLLAWDDLRAQGNTAGRRR